MMAIFRRQCFKDILGRRLQCTGMRNRHRSAGSASSLSSCFSTTRSSSSNCTRCNSTEEYAGDEHLVQWRVEEHAFDDSNDDKRTYRIGRLTLNSPDTFNALTVEMGRDFSALIAQITHNISCPENDNTREKEVRAVILTGQGSKAFSAGGNLEWLRSLQHNAVHINANAMLDFYKSFLCIRSIPVPVIAALQGPAIGAGAGLALACDMRTAAPNIRQVLAFNFTKLGIHVGMGGSHYLPQVLGGGGGSGILNEILLTGRSLSSEEALQLGLVNRVASKDKKETALSCAHDLAHVIATQQHPVAVRTTLQTLRNSQDFGLEQALQREAFAQAVCYNRNDWGEGVNAVAAKRKPVFDDYHVK